ncbi:MAG: PhzF family phenazine biosynthesis protein [Pseudomonadota bacterium]
MNTLALPLYVVDAFTSALFRGNPAAVCPLKNWLPPALMQSIAAENNLAETAFLVEEGNGWGLKWFTPEVEIELCGHATLASAFILAKLKPQQLEFRFHTLSGELIVTRNGERFTLDFPSRPLQTLPREQELSATLGVPVRQVTRAGKVLLVELADAASVRNFQPDFAVIRKLDGNLNLTALGDDCDFVSRYFAPGAGVDEDPVTGSAHCGLVPYWNEKLGKTKLHARQVSARGGELFCEYLGERVLMSGHAVQYSEGTIYLPAP